MTTPGNDAAPSPSAGSAAVIVGIGASAGGIAALGKFFSGVPRPGGAAYVVILHMSPEYESRLPEVLEGFTALPVVRVHETVRLEPDRVYVLTPNTSLRMQDGLLSVTEMTRPEERRAPVDIFFRTLASSQR